MIREITALVVFCGVTTTTVLIAIAIWGISDENAITDLRSDLASPACLTVYSKCAQTSLSPSPSSHRDPH